MRKRIANIKAKIENSLLKKLIQLLIKKGIITKEDLK